MPITVTGYQRRTLDVVLASIQDSLRSKISAKLDLSERTVLGNSSNIDADQIDQLEQLIEEAYNAFDVDNASDDRFVALSALSGVRRRVAPTKGLVTATISVTGAHTYAPGDLAAHVVDEATNRWLNRDAVVTTSGTHDYTPVFESESAGAAAIAEAGTLTVIATPVTGWNSITNPAAASPGKDIESIPELRIRREVALAPGGSRTRVAVRSKLALLDGVLSAECFENTTNFTDSNGILPHGIRPVVWDGSPGAADDDQIAQAIYDFGSEGILSQGAQSGTAQDPELGPVPIAFDRATTSAVTVAVNIQSTSGVAIDDVQAAILAAMPTRVGREVTFHKLAGSVFSVPGVDDWVTFTVNGGSADLPAVQSLIYLLTAGSITVTGDVT
jgi:uncharacterized phage protein gp47/JayE